MGRLDGKVAIVTGAASGFGEGIARRFAEEGALVVVADVNERGAERVRDGIGGESLAMAVDVSRRSDIEGLVYTARSAFGRVDVMVNNAGFTHRKGDLLAVDEPAFDLVGAINMKAIYFATLAVVPIMERNGGGVILNTASIAGLRPQPGLTWYNASKGWVIAATKSMALELAPRRIRVNCLCPASGETAMLPLFMGTDTPERRAELAADIPLGRLAQPLDVANAALWLASEEAAFVTGVALEVDGGWSI
jgi:3-oxoacyl-[acyl-carrier protein] reductase